MTTREGPRPKARDREASAASRAPEAAPRSALSATEALQRSAGNAAVNAAAALDGAARADIERRLGQPLPDARLRSGPDTERILANERALALARGRDVYLPAGVDPSGAIGRTLIAHELAHVVQQTRDAPANQAADLESEAHAVAAGDAEAVAGSAPFGASQAWNFPWEEEEPPKKADLPPDFNQRQYARIAANPQAWKDEIQSPALAEHMREDPGIRGLLKNDKEFQAYLKDPQKNRPPGYKPSAPIQDADTAAQRVRVPKIDRSYDDRTNTWTITEDGQAVAQVKVPNKDAQVNLTWDENRVMLAPGSDKGARLVGADPVQKAEGYSETAPLLAADQPQQKARPKKQTPQEKFVSQLSEADRQAAEANKGRQPKQYYTKEMAELDEAPGFLEALDFAGPIPVGTIGWQLGTLATGETISGLPVERSETAKQIGKEIAMGVAMDWVGGKLFEGLGKLAGGGEGLAGREVGEALSHKGTLNLDPMPHELPKLTTEPHVPQEVGKVGANVDVPPATTIEGAPKVETPEVKSETPEVKSETPEVKEAPEAKKDVPDIKGASTPVPTERTPQMELDEFKEFIKQEGGEVRARGAPQELLPHARGTETRRALGLGPDMQSAHGLPQAQGAKVPGYNPRAAVTTLQQQLIHTRLDQPMKDAFISMRQNGRTTASGQEIFDIVADSIRKSPDLPPDVAETLVARLEDEMWMELRMSPTTPYPLPYPNIKPHP